MPKLTSSLRNSALVALLLVLAGCNKDAAQPWHYWIAPLLMFGAVVLVLVVLPLQYYLKVYRLKHRGR